MKIKGLDRFMEEPISYEKIASEDQVYKISKSILADREEYGRNVARGIIERLIERTKAVNKAGRDGLGVQDLRMFAAEYGVFLEGKDDQNVS